MPLSPYLMLLTTAAPLVAPAPLPLPSPVPAAVIRAAAEVGITPAALAASGFTAAEASGILSGIEQATAERTALGEAWLAAKQRGDTLRQACASAALDPRNENLHAEVQSAEEAYDGAVAQVQAAKAALRAAALEGAASTSIARLSLFNAAQVQGLPAEMRIVQWEPAVLDPLQRAVIAARRAERRGEAVPSAAAAILTQARSNPAVVESGQWLFSRLEDIEAAFQPAP